MRSKLFVPGARPELFAKALASAASAVSFDLEDAVTEDRKAEARASVAAFVATSRARASGKLLIVRCNALGTAHFEADLHALAGAGLDLLNVPKLDSVDELRAACVDLSRAEKMLGITQPLRLLVTIETPRALRQAALMAAADARVAGLQLGLADLFEPLSIERHDPANVHAVMLSMRLAAAEAGVMACDGAYPALDDAEGFRAEATMARRLGYIGKSCVHPRQVVWANEIFRCSAAELAHAQRVVKAAREAAGQGRGAFVVDGKMIDLPFIRHAQAIVDAAQLESGEACA